MAVLILAMERRRWVWFWMAAILLTLVSAALFALIAWLSAVEALTTMHRVSNMVRWPHWPFQLSVAFGSAMYAIVLLIQSVRMVGGKPGPANAGR